MPAHFLFSLLLLFLTPMSGLAAERDPLLQPFASDSIWNHPIGDQAVYVPAQLMRSRIFGVFAEEEIIVLSPDAPLTAVYENHADWEKGADRSTHDGPIIDHLPIPSLFTTHGHIPGTPNHAASVLRADGRTLHHSQPFTRAKAGAPATSHYVWPDSDIYGDGIIGAHGGSGLSALGGTIRLGELVPDGHIAHALKIVMSSKYFSCIDDGTVGYRWPATKADGHVSIWTYRGSQPALQMGSLLALKPNFTISSLRTEPARIIARALRDYGCYVCDSSGWDAYYLAYEWSPRGRVCSEFKQHWGHDLVMKDLRHPWSQDMAMIIESLHVIDDNAPQRIGGAGKPRVAMAPPLEKP